MVLVGSVGRWISWFIESVPSTVAVPSPIPSPSWHQYVRSPTNRIVSPVSVISVYTTGNVTNPDRLLTNGGGVTTLARKPPPKVPPWPPGTVVNASSFHPQNYVNGQSRTYFPRNAIDGDFATFWNDDTYAEYPDVLMIRTPDAINLSGITILSSKEGVPVDFTVDVLIGDNSWWLAGEVTNNAATHIRVPFKSTFHTRGVRITVTQDQTSASGEFTRINEVWPGIVDDFPKPASVVVDFGKVVVGYLSISFAGASSNSPGLRLAFSESTEYLTDLSDFTRSYNVSQIL